MCGSSRVHLLHVNHTKQQDLLLCTLFGRFACRTHPLSACNSKGSLLTLIFIDIASHQVLDIVIRLVRSTHEGAHLHQDTFPGMLARRKEGVKNGNGIE